VLATEPLHLEAQVLCLKVRSLYLELVRHLWPVYMWWFEELVRLREVRSNIASGGLSME
jgi:hypothetical protein